MENTETFEKKTYNQILQEFNIEESPKVKSVRVVVEKLANGYVSDADGQRKLYLDTKDVIKAVGLNGILEGITDNEYKLNIDLVPKEEYDDYADAINFSRKCKEEEKLTLQSAKEQGIIEVEKFNPNKQKESDETDFEIKVTASNAYPIARLKAIDFKSFDEQLPLTNTEKSLICNLKSGTMYGLWRKVVAGECMYQLTSSRIAMTILAKYYEKSLNIRTSTKDQQEQLKENLLTSIRELELLTDGNKFVKSSEISKKISEMRKLLIK